MTLFDQIQLKIDMLQCYSSYRWMSIDGEVFTEQIGQPKGDKLNLQ